MTTTLLSSIAGSLLSLLFSYLPGLSDWYARMGVNPDDGGTRKRLLMLALLCLTALGSFGLACSGWGLAFGLAQPTPHPFQHQKPTLTAVPQSDPKRWQARKGFAWWRVTMSDET